jgi:hypothetical protein
MDVTTTEIMWLTSLFQELGHSLSSPSILWCDNLDATFFAVNPVFHSLTKHIELDFYFDREQLAAQKLLVHFICSADRLGDFFTKSLAKSHFQMLRTKLTVCTNPLSLQGRIGEGIQAILEPSIDGSNRDEDV